MKTLNGEWNVRGNDLVVDNSVVPGVLLTIRAGATLQVLLRVDDKLERYTLKYNRYVGTTEIWKLLQKFSLRKLETTNYAPMRYWSVAQSDNTGEHRLRGHDILSEEPVLSSTIRAIRFNGDTYASVLTYSNRRDIWEVISIYGTAKEIASLNEYCTEHHIQKNPSVDASFMRHFKKV